MNVTAEFGALGSKGSNNVWLGHARKMGERRLKILWRLRHNTGNFAESGHPRPFSCPISARIQCLAAEFPTQRNREFSNAYQGIFPG
jgi:hypothetical protein